MADNLLKALFALKKAILYLRVSTRRQAQRGGGNDEGFSIPAQREAGRKKAAELGAVIVKEFKDAGASAKSADRKDLQAMLDYIKDHDVDYVIVHKLDRLARNRWDDADITRVLSQRGVKLISVSESIDETPSGMLLHGIMSSVAEFYSRNLATEAMKGMTKKVESGGTVSKAPMGYLNLRRVDEMGREERYVEPDPKRAPLIQLAFTMFATGDWVIASLAEYLAARGLTTRATPEIPSKPIDKKALNKIMVNPYYKGVIKFKGKCYPGNHAPLVDKATWQKVQDILASHINGERTREHPHFLKSTVYCGSCGERLLIQYAKSKSGIRYPYFSCAGRHNKRNDCKQKSVLIEEVERQVENIYARMSFAPEYRAQLECWVLDEIHKSTDKIAVERKEMEAEKDKLERKQKKLLEAYYADSLPLNLFKDEQKQLEDALAAIDRRIQLQVENSAEIEERLRLSLDLMEDCGKLYAAASDYIKRAYNQAIFEKIYINRNENDITATPVFAETYALLFNQKVDKDDGAKPVQEDDARVVKEKESGSPLNAGAVSLAWFLPPKIQNTDQSNFFGQCFIKDILVDLRRIELLTSALRTRHSPS